MSSHIAPSSPPPPRPLRRPRPRRFIAPSIAFAMLLMVSGAAGVIGFRIASVDLTASTALPPAAKTSPPLPLRTVAGQVMSRVVTIEGSRADDEELGTGWLLDARGDFVTNAHVIEGHLSVRIRDRAGVGHVGVVMGVDRDQDIALIRSADGFMGTPLAGAGPHDPTVPMNVVTIASGRATGHDDITTATLSRLHQDVPVKGNPSVEPGTGTTITTYHDMMVVRGATIYSGTSGGPVLDGHGTVLGIVTLKSKDLAEGYAIPLPRVLSELEAFASRPPPSG